MIDENLEEMLTDVSSAVNLTWFTLVVVHIANLAMKPNTPDLKIAISSDLNLFFFNFLEPLCVIIRSAVAEKHFWNYSL